MLTRTILSIKLQGLSTNLIPGMVFQKRLSIDTKLCQPSKNPSIICCFPSPKEIAKTCVLLDLCHFELFSNNRHHRCVSLPWVIYHQRACASQFFVFIWQAYHFFPSIWNQCCGYSVDWWFWKLLISGD